MSIGGNDLLTQVESENPKLGQFLRRYVIPAIETTARNASVSAIGKIATPAPPEMVHVDVSGELMKVTIQHNAPIQKGIQYITHISTNPQFSTPEIVDHHGTTRSPALYNLPTKDSLGNTINYHVRVIAQNPGSDASKPTYFGGDAPVPVNMGGTTQMDLRAGTGSGTGSSDGQQSLVGLGKTIFRSAPAAKRTVNT